jgi:hypothetical protein
LAAGEARSTTSIFAHLSGPGEPTGPIFFEIDSIASILTVGTVAGGSPILGIYFAVGAREERPCLDTVWAGVQAAFMAHGPSSFAPSQ